MRYSQRVISPFLLLILVINVTALAADAFLMLKSESQEDYKSEATDRDLRLANSRYNSVKRSAQSFGDKVNFNDDTEPPFSTKSGPGISVLGGSSGSWADISFRYRKNITISSSKDLTNFPVLVDLYDTDLQKYARVDAWDIMFTNTSGTKLPHEIEHYDRTYNSTHAHLVAWVMANLSSSQNTIVSMYFGNPITANQENPEGVWDSNYVMVHHMNEDPTTTIYDSTSKENNAAANGGMTSGDQVAGMMNGGIDFDGNDDYLTVPDDASLNITGEITLEAWVYYKGYDVGHRYAKILHKPLSSIIDPWNVYSLALDDTMGDSANLRFEISNGSAGSQEAVESTSIVALNGWTHVVATYNGATMRIYINGVDENQNSASIIIGTNNNPLQIGSWDIATDNRWYGILDELRISNVARSADWIVTSWNNQNDPASFYSIGQKEVCPDTDDWAFPIMKYRKNITIAASEVAADLIDFPVLIDLNDSDLHDSNKVQADGDDILFTAEDDWRWSDELLTNGGFDLGDLSGWVTSGDWNVGTDPPQGGAGTQAGSFCAFVDSTSSSSDYLRQDVDISSYGVDIDAGKALASVSGWLVSAESGSDDSRIRVEYLNSLKNVIATPLDSGL
ncbi:MAG: LamG-like jellyroll fold domain-containing protein, partial [Candidatus Hodarchaeota archaeon]